jgi:hypothetical protein
MTKSTHNEKRRSNFRLFYALDAPLICSGGENQHAGRANEWAMIVLLFRRRATPPEYLVKKSLESDDPRPWAVVFRPIHGFATSISKAFFRQSQKTLTPPKGRGFPGLNKPARTSQKTLYIFPIARTRPRH